MEDLILKKDTHEYFYKGGKVKYPVMELDKKGRCCGRKPIVYKRKGEYFCPRCDRAYDLITKRQIPNWAYKTIKE